MIYYNLSVSDPLPPKGGINFGDKYSFVATERRSPLAPMAIGVRGQENLPE